MKKPILISLSFLMASNNIYAAGSPTITNCSDLGYKVDISKCQNLNITPLLCPFFNKDEHKTACLLKSCRGYPLKAEDFDKLASDNQPMKNHIDGVFIPKQKNAGGAEGCKAGIDMDENGNIHEIWYYRIKKCKEGSAFLNGVCDVGCDRINKYPYKTHPGNLAGNVENCIDDKGETFGYTSCNDGWDFSSGRCELASCSIKEYPYDTNPNLIENRGTIQTCKIGGNSYYRYSSCNSGFTISSGVCRKKCYIAPSSCSYTENTVTYKTYSQTYRDWKCNISTTLCQVGDIAVVGEHTLGTIIHIAENSDDRTRILGKIDFSVWIENNDTIRSLNTPVPDYYSWDSAKQDFYGKMNTNIIINFAKQGSPYIYPAFKTAYNFSTGCAYDWCKAGEWYMPALGEMMFVSTNRHLLYNILRTDSLYNTYYLTSSESRGNYYTMPFNDSQTVRNLNNGGYMMIFLSI